MVRQLSSPSVSGGTLDAISTAIDNRIINGAVLISHVGRTTERDALPQAVDYLVRLEGVQTAIVFGLVNDAMYWMRRSMMSGVAVAIRTSRAVKSRSVSLLTTRPTMHSCLISSDKSLLHACSRNSICPNR